ncbi:hypothetical protein N657DRAFT_685087 [Parathielavia appendiculata]|uniref:Uncharacterized protein n=1 Tax=Parathielavia appendiculata TaxID=2587402 RepID=A0AAN6YZQ2_9PEZI|nr:hypothetical protein N657DRAFT_685087 [Parathielavia appendiculata]
MSKPSTSPATTSVPSSSSTSDAPTAAPQSIDSAGSPTTSGASTSSPSTALGGGFTWEVTQSVAGHHAPLILARGFMVMMGAFYNQQIIHEPVRKMLGSGISGGELAQLSFGAGRLGLIMGQFGSIFVAGTSFVDVDYCERDGIATGMTPCPPRISGNPWVFDVIISVLVVQASMVLYSLTKWFQKPGGISADPTTIAGVAAVMGHPEVEQLFSSFPGDMSEDELKDVLKGHKFMLGEFAMEDGIVKYGIMPVPLEDRQDEDDNNGIFGRIGQQFSGVRERLAVPASWKPTPLVVDLCFGVFILGLLGLVLAALATLDQPEFLFPQSVTSNRIGMKIGLGLLGVLISLYWGRIFQETQTMTPYQRLYHSSSHPFPTILLRRHTSPLCAILPLLRTAHLMAASVAITALLSEVLIVTLAGIVLPQRVDELQAGSPTETLICAAISAAILLLMLIQLVAILIWRRAGPKMPRRPGSIGMVMTYLAGTEMVRSFYGLDKLTSRERDRMVCSRGRVYGYGWRKEGDAGWWRAVVEEVGESAERRGFLDDGSTNRGERGREEGRLLTRWF